MGDGRALRGEDCQSQRQNHCTGKGMRPFIRAINVFRQSKRTFLDAPPQDAKFAFDYKVRVMSL